MSKVYFSYRSGRARITCDDNNLFIGVRESFCVDNPAAKYSEYADTFITPITAFGTLEIGFIGDVINRVYELNPSAEIELDDEIRYWFNPMNEQMISFDTEQFQARDYQAEAVRVSLERGRGLIESPTASGKSFIMYTLIRNLIHYANNDAKILLLVPTTQLVKQLKKEFIQYGEFPNMSQCFSSKNKTLNPDVQVIISNRQWLERHADELPHITHVIVDEVQMLAGQPPAGRDSKYNKVGAFVNSLTTPYKFGFSGTIPTEEAKYWRVTSIIGSVLFKERAYNMIERGVCAKLNIVSLRLVHKYKPFWEITDDNFNKMHVIERQYLQSLKSYRDFIGALVGALDGNTLIIFDNTEYGVMLYNELKMSQLHKKVVFIDGSIDVDDREAICDSMEQSNDHILVAQDATFSTGINVKNLDYIYIDRGKALTRTIQTIGRSLRKLLDTSIATIFDVHHNFKYSEQHFEERKPLYSEHYNILISESITYNL